MQPLPLHIPHWLTDKQETLEEAGQELGSGAWEHELSFDRASKVELVPEMAGLRNRPPIKLLMLVSNHLYCRVLSSWARLGGHGNAVLGPVPSPQEVLGKMVGFV